MYEWHMDLTPPREGDMERRINFARGFGKASLVISPALRKLLEACNALSDAFVISRPTMSDHRPILPALKPKTPFKNDPPTNRLYPTSFDSWFNEYDQPLRSPQVRQSRRPYRR